MSATCLAMTDHGQCRATHVELRTAHVERGAASIRGSVGAAAVNHVTDVKTIQAALNDVPASEGGPLPTLKVDGSCGQKTLAAIRKFQSGFMRWPDARIDPNGKTLARLNTARGGGSLLPNPYVIPFILTLIPDVLRSLKAAETEFLRASTTLDQPLSAPGRRERMKRINLHFAIDSFPDRRIVFHRTYETIKRMSRAVARHHRGPEAQRLGVFEANRVERMENGIKAYAFTGGYDRPGVVNHPMEIREDLIYICSALAAKPRDFGIIALVHELAHFVGPAETPAAIIDYGYGWTTDERIKRLLPWQRIHNAQSYSNFAFDCAFGRAPVGV
jgi:hypothetical protein